MASAELPPPLRVSPFIRACRYGALAAGITYGVLKYKLLKRKETQIREFEHKQKVVLDAKKAEETTAKQRRVHHAHKDGNYEGDKHKCSKKLLQYIDEMIYLAKECGITVPPNF